MKNQKKILDNLDPLIDQGYVFIFVAFKLYSPKVSSFRFSKKIRIMWLVVEIQPWVEIFEISLNKFWNPPSIWALQPVNYRRCSNALLALYNQIEMNLSQACTSFLTVIVWKWQFKIGQWFFQFQTALHPPF